ncbi:hypothetical protein [Lysinibacillus sphaericus]|uniref:hypothetical protein n=1 Tax=Lysinibacillus sphaericus TaxID=1421 RepID=UPI001A9FD8A6|nr:hypothetical protein [Lysinibacillus sphaericus]QTB28861.1 hypothetical protein J2D51_09780 [Lysinibacillus sphaericus]
MTKNFKRKMMAVPFAAMTTMMLMTSAFAAEATPVKQVEPIVEVAPAKTTTNLKLESNNDTERRQALEESFNVKLSDTDIWADKAGEHVYDPYGNKVEYTPHEALKALNVYAVNANRQELIQYGIRTNDWQPYYAFEAQKTPAYFDLVDGKYEYNKTFWGNQIENTLKNMKEKLADNWGNEEKRAEIEADMKAYIKKQATIFNEAPGMVPYVIGLNHTATLAKENGVAEVAKDYFDSKYNHPDVMTKGIFKDGSNPLKK